MNDLPPLPPPDRTMHQYGKQIDHFTADQMRAYAQAALDALNDELEASLKRMIDAGLGQIPAANSKPANPPAKRRRSRPLERRVRRLVENATVNIEKGTKSD